MSEPIKAPARAKEPVNAPPSEKPGSMAPVGEKPKEMPAALPAKSNKPIALPSPNLIARKSPVAPAVTPAAKPAATPPEKSNKPIALPSPNLITKKPADDLPAAPAAKPAVATPDKSNKPIPLPSPDRIVKKPTDALPAAPVGKPAVAPLDKSAKPIALPSPEKIAKKPTASLAPAPAAKPAPVAKPAPQKKAPAPEPSPAGTTSTYRVPLGGREWLWFVPKHQRKNVGRSLSLLMLFVMILVLWLVLHPPAVNPVAFTHADYVSANAKIHEMIRARVGNQQITRTFSVAELNAYFFSMIPDSAESTSPWVPGFGGMGFELQDKSLIMYSITNWKKFGVRVVYRIQAEPYVNDNGFHATVSEASIGQLRLPIGLRWIISHRFSSMFTELQEDPILGTLPYAIEIAPDGVHLTNALPPPKKR